MPKTAPIRPLIIRLLLICLTLTTTACIDHEAERQAAAERARREAETIATQGSVQVRALLSAGDLERAHAFAVEISTRYPDTAAGKQLATSLPALAKEAERVGEQRRLESLWTYHEVDDKEAGGIVRTAYIQGEQKTAGEPAAVRLVWRRHPAWGQSVYLLMDSGGDFACAEECPMQQVVDGAAPAPILVSRAKDNDPPALFIEDDVAAARTLTTAKQLTLSIPHQDGRVLDFLFEVSALDAARMGPAPAK